MPDSLKYDPIRNYHKGKDILDFTEDAIGHGCNCFKAFGAGLALQIKRRYPEMYKADLAWNEQPEERLGKFTKTFLKDGRVGYNLYTQFHYGRTNTQTKYWAVGTSLCAVLEDMAKNGLNTLALPKIGCGLGGGEWDRVARIISEVNNGIGVDHIKIYIYIL